MKALLESLCHRHDMDIGFSVMGKDMVVCALEIAVILKKISLELKVVDMQEWRHPFLNILGLNIHKYP